MKARGTRGAAHRAESVFRAKRKGCPPGCPGWPKRGVRVFQSARVAELTPGGPRNDRVTVSSEGGSAIAREGSGEGELDVREKRPVRRQSVAEGAAVIGRHVSAQWGRAGLGDEAGQRHATGELIGGRRRVMVREEKRTWFADSSGSCSAETKAAARASGRGPGVRRVGPQTGSEAAACGAGAMGVQRACRFSTGVRAGISQPALTMKRAPAAARQRATARRMLSGEPRITPATGSTLPAITGRGPARGGRARDRRGGRGRRCPRRAWRFRGAGG